MITPPSSVMSPPSPSSPSSFTGQPSSPLGSSTTSQSPSLQRQRSSSSETHVLPEAKRLRPNLSLSFDAQDAVREEWRKSVLAQLGEAPPLPVGGVPLERADPIAQRRLLRKYHSTNFSSARSLAIPYVDTPPLAPCSSYAQFPQASRLPGVRSTAPTPSPSPDETENNCSSYLRQAPLDSSSTHTHPSPQGPPQLPAVRQCSFPLQNQNDNEYRPYIPVRKSTLSPRGIPEVRREPNVNWPEATRAGGGSPNENLPVRRSTDPGPSTARSDSSSKEKEKVVSSLVSASVLAIESIWGVPSIPAVETGGVIPLSWFVTEVLRRSRTSCSTLQVALYYLHKSRRQIREVVAQCETLRERCSYPSPPLTPVDESGPVDKGESTIHEIFIQEKNNPVLCGRRMFLASLISARLPVLEINLNERVFLNLIKFELHVSAPDFQKWTQRLASLPPRKDVAESSSAGSTGPPSSSSRESGLSRSASEYPPAEPMHDIVASSSSSRAYPSSLLARARSHPQLASTAGRSSSMPRVAEAVDCTTDAPLPPTPDIAPSCSNSNASTSDDEEDEEEEEGGRQYRAMPRTRGPASYGRTQRSESMGHAMDLDTARSGCARQALAEFHGGPSWSSSHNVVV